MVFEKVLSPNIIPKKTAEQCSLCNWANQMGRSPHLHIDQLYKIGYAEASSLPNQQVRHQSSLLRPCRSEVRLEHGCKIYFDPVSTATREEFARKVAEDVCEDTSRSQCIDTVSL